MHERLTNERFVYLGDTARVPYGTKSLGTIERYAIESARFLEAKGIKLLVVACNTASALALPAIRNAVDVEVVGVIEPGARAAVEASKTGQIGVIATEATVQSGAYQVAISAIESSARVTMQACPLFVALAEEGWAETEVARLVAVQYLDEMRDSGVDTLVLGCTHYPILRNIIHEVMGDVLLVDSGEAAAREVDSRLRERAMSSTLQVAGDHERELCDDLDHFYVTDAADRFSRVAELFLGIAPSVLEAAELWGHDELRTY
jgi:glutamate racemase